jgi:hypothetical protein
MYLSMRMAARAVDYIRDLKLVIFRNKTTVDFVTSDNPATMTNRFHFQKLKSNKFGLSNSGAMFSMPLSPRLSTMCYDTGTYSVPNASGTQFVDLTKDIDATALNQLQYLSASKNIYFRNLSDAERIKSELELFAEKRAKAAPITRIYVRDDSATSVVGRLRDPRTGQMEKYREGTPEEEQTARETLAATSFEFAEPFIWLSKLKFRDKPRYYNNGTAIGYVRKAEWLRKGGRP